jgi:hypothetical protein
MQFLARPGFRPKMSGAACHNVLLPETLAVLIKINSMAEFGSIAG